MRLSASLFLVAPALITCASVSTSAETRVTKADPERLQRDVAWLADDVREGRRAGTSKCLDAAEFLATRMQTLGLEPAGTVGFGQEFDVPLEARDGGRSTIEASGWVRISSPGTDPSLRLDAGADLVPLFCSDGPAVSGKTQFVGFGIDDADRSRLDFEGVDLKDKIAVIVRGVPKYAPVKKKVEGAPKPAEAATPPPAAPHDTASVTKGDGWGGGGLIFTKVMNAKRRGAVGVILLPALGDETAPLLGFGEGGTARAGIPCVMVSWKGATAVLGTEAVKSFAAAAAAEQVVPVPERPELKLFSDVHRERGPARNVLGKLRGLDPSRTVVVGAHYDHLGLGGHGSLAGGGRQIHNGADDNASGTAAVLEMARLLAAGPRPDCDVLFALWSGEELGLLGSEWWSEHPTVPLTTVAANLNLDMVGRADSNKLQVLAAGTAEPFAGWMNDAGAAAGLELVVSTSSNMMGGSSDHATFLKRKIPALHLFSGLHADYHKPSDDTERFEAPGAAKVTDFSVDLVRRLCSAGKLAYVEPKVDPNAKVIQSGFRSWFGSIPNYAWDKGGVLIDGTSAGSPAEHAGFLKGDVLLGIGDIEIKTIDDFMFALQTYKPGDVVLVKFTRDGMKDFQETRVTLATRGQQ